jgi:hypothetical protein
MIYNSVSSQTPKTRNSRKISVTARNFGRFATTPLVWGVQRARVICAKSGRVKRYVSRMSECITLEPLS